MLCPVCKTQLKSTIFHNVEVNYCPKCLGIWFDENELNWAKDDKDDNLRWLDIDLWKEETEFKVSRGIRLCPKCRVPLYEVRYGDSNIIVDVCNLCHGIWLDRAEFKKIIEYLHKKKDYEVLNNYAKNLFQQLAEVFSGPKTLREEVLDFLAILKILNYKFVTKHLTISEMILDLPK